MKQSAKFGIELNDSKLYLYDLDYPEGKIEVDQIVFEATWQSSAGNRASGYIRAVHGLPQDVAQILPAHLLSALGVGAQFRAPPRLVTRSGSLLRAVAGKATFERVARQ